MGGVGDNGMMRQLEDVDFIQFIHSDWTWLGRAWLGGGAGGGGPHS